jgi:hypothetical protein
MLNNWKAAYHFALVYALLDVTVQTTLHCQLANVVLLCCLLNEHMDCRGYLASEVMMPYDVLFCVGARKDDVCATGKCAQPRGFLEHIQACLSR